MADQQMDPEQIRRMRELRRRRKAQKRRRQLIQRTVIFFALLVILGVCVFFLRRTLKADRDDSAEQSAESSSLIVDENDLNSGEAEESTESTESTEGEAAAQPADEGSGASYNADAADKVPATKEEALALAASLAVMYDYDGAIAKLQSWSDQSDADIVNAIADYTSQRDACVTVDVSTVPHIFFHSLINDNRAFIVTDAVTEGRVIANNAAMATVDEFNHVINAMYENGYVMITLDDMVIRNEDGTFSKNTNLRLPAGKKAFIMSEDDLSYYHSYGENGVQGYADRLVVTEEGKVKCEFVDKEGNHLVGDYDMVPLIDSFIEAHPDFVYKNARPTIALTGYNGIFGYITNTYYKDGGDMENLGQTQINWLAAHPEYNYDEDCAKARQVAEALKAEGWTFASHTYGHLDASAQPLESLQRDHERWKLCVGDIIGGTDKIIFAFGADIGTAGEYTMDNAKYAYYKSEGFDFYCNCDGTWGWTQITPNYVRTGRFAIDGFTLYQAMTPDAHSHERCAYNYEQLGVHDIASFFDPDRTTPIESE